METVIKSRNLAISTEYRLSSDRETCKQYTDGAVEEYSFQWIVTRINKRGLTLYTFNLTGQLTEIFLNRRDWDGIPNPD